MMYTESSLQSGYKMLQQVTNNCQKQKHPRVDCAPVLIALFALPS